MICPTVAAVFIGLLSAGGTAEKSGVFYDFFCHISLTKQENCCILTNIKVLL